jgi:hypothetical protein
MIYLKDVKTEEIFAVDDANIDDFQDYYLNPQNLISIDEKIFDLLSNRLNKQKGGIQNGTTR